MCVAGLLRFYNLGEQSIWNDEWFSIDVARSAIIDIQPKLITFYHHPPLFFYLLHAVVKLFDDQPVALRCISAISGMLTIGMVYYFTSKMFDNVAGIIAATFCCFSPFHLAYSQEGRPYALAALLCLVSCCTMLMFLQDRKRFRLVIYFLSSIALLYTHHWGIFILTSQIIIILFFTEESFETKKIFTVIWGVIAICYLPEMISLLHQFSAQGTGGGWWWAEQPNGNELLLVAEAFSGTYFKMASSVFDSSVTTKIAGASSIILLFLLGIINILKQNSSLALRGAFLSAFLTLFLPFILSFYKPEIFLWYRYTVIVIPILAVCFGGLCTEKGRKMIASICVGAVIVLGVMGTFSYFSWSKSNVKEVAQYTEQATRENVSFLIRPAYFAPLLNYYYKGTVRQLDETYLDHPLGEIIDTAASFAYISLDTPNEIRDYMNDHFDKISEKKFPGEAHMGIIVSVYKQKPEEDEEQEK
jgi:4-amino-4-deoxy-L-arabinose transferase-like glycosyltransferase